MKRVFALLIAICMLTSLWACSFAEEGGMRAGIYYGVGEGRNGAIVVKVTLTEDAIEAVEVVSSQETWNTGSVPVAEYPGKIVDNQSLAIDIVSGATISSVAMLNAVRDCIKQAGGDPAVFNTPVKVSAPCEDCATDIVVIGGGGAGMTAAAKAAQAGKSVILVEKLGILGGTSNYSIEGFGAVGDKTHVGLGCDTTAEMMCENLINANPNGTAEAFKVLTSNNGAAADWLRSIGAELTVAGGQVSAASSREVGELGVTIISALIAECEKAGVDLRLNSKATELVAEDGVVKGVKVETKEGTYTIDAGAVIIASGGFGANNEMVASYVPYLEGYKSSCTVGATGDGQKMAEAVGAELGNMDYIRVNFTYTTKDNGYYYYMGSLFNTGAIFVNDEGKRFVNDQGGYGVGHTVVQQGGGSGWAIFDSSIAKGVADVRHYGDLGLYVSAPTIEELAEKIGVDAQALGETIETYKGYVAAGKDEEFGRGMLNMTFDEAPFYACRMTCRVQGTFGGITINDKAEVLTGEGETIPGLFAAGECANDGTWGANPAAVNIVFGTVAANSAVEFLG